MGHGICENHLLSKTLYPEGWEFPVNRFTGERSENGINRLEQSLVKALITHAIDNGILIRQPDGEVEKEFGDLLGTVDEIEGVKIKMIGFLDYFYENHIDDHKFIGPNSGRYYNKKKLKNAVANESVCLGYVRRGPYYITHRMASVQSVPQEHS